MKNLFSLSVFLFFSIFFMLQPSELQAQRASKTTVRDNQNKRDHRAKSTFQLSKTKSRSKSYKKAITNKRVVSPAKTTQFSDGSVHFDPACNHLAGCTCFIWPNGPIGKVKAEN